MTPVETGQGRWYARAPEVAVNFNILGPFEVRDREGREVRLPAGRERSLLALLLIHRGEVVSTDRIVDALWGETPPGTAAKAVQGYVSHLRRMLEPAHPQGGADGLLLTHAPGYVLRTDVAVDATRFEQLAAEGRRALEDGSAAEAAALLEDALGLWRGPALADFTFDDFAQTEIHRLEELRLEATEDKIQAQLDLGRHGDLVGQLETLVAAHPLRERLRGQLMLALYRSGRQADALQVYRDGRRLLAGELGLEPGPELQRLEHAILEHDPELETPALAPLPAREGEPEPPPSAPSERRLPRRLLVGALLAACAVAAVGVYALTRGESAGSVEVVPPAVAVVDPATNRVVASIPAGSKPVSVAGGEGGVWVGDARDGTVTRIDPVTRKVVKTIGIGAPAVDVAVGVGGVWVATGGFGQVVRIDPELDAVADRIELGDPSDPVVPAASSVAAGPEGVWVGAFDGLVRINPPTGELVDRVDLGDTPAQQISVGSGAVWSTIISSRAKRVEATSGQVTAEFYAGAFVYPIALRPDAVWIGGGAGQLWKVDPVTGAQLSTSSAGSFPAGIALERDAVWVAVPETGAVVRVDQATGEVLATLQIGGAPEDLVVAEGLVWIAVPEPSSES
jgi:DNA-binding SARP family transcriptional activator